MVSSDTTMKNLSFLLVTITFVLSPLFVFAQADPHTNITPIEDQVVQNIEAFTAYVQSENISREQLLEAMSDLQFVLDFYLETLQD